MKLATKQVRELAIADALRKYSKCTQVEGQTLCDDQHVKVMMAFLPAGIPISKFEYLQEIIEENVLSLINTRHMLVVVPFILEEEQSSLSTVNSSLLSLMAHQG